MKTIREWIEELPKGYRELALENKRYAFYHIDWEQKEETMVDAINNAFYWKSTNEGRKFWAKVTSFYRTGERLPPLPDMTDVSKLTTDRGALYGRAYDHFRCTQGMFDEWLTRYQETAIDDDLGKCLKHITYMILDKLARAANDPTHMDNFDDIQGYASLWKKCVEAHEETE